MRTTINKCDRCAREGENGDLPLVCVAVVRADRTGYGGGYAPAYGVNSKPVQAEWCNDCLKAMGLDGRNPQSPPSKVEQTPSQMVEDALRAIVREEIGSTQS